jgi:drug/metabolite transporter (DMT)-like permease
MTKSNGAAYALMSALLFGASTPAAKLLLAGVDPRILAGLLYCGAGFGVALTRRILRIFRVGGFAPEAALTPAEWPWLAAATIAGGIVGPLLLMTGLARTDAATASLLLTLEGVFTAALAWFAFNEHFDRWIVLGMAAIVAGSICLAWSGAPNFAGFLGPLAIAGACLAWAIDNNLTRRVSLSDPLQIVEIKGATAGLINLCIALSLGASAPSIGMIAGAAIVGFLGYGVSLALFVLALRHIGTARTGAYFSAAPFLGAALAVALLGEPLSAQLVVGAALIAAGVGLHLAERHEHEHAHDAIEHAHPHVHDEHHQHEHDTDQPQAEPHTHWHAHAPIIHAHPHMPDVHHRHDH